MCSVNRRHDDPAGPPPEGCSSPRRGARCSMWPSSPFQPGSRSRSSARMARARRPCCTPRHVCALLMPARSGSRARARPRPMRQRCDARSRSSFRVRSSSTSASSPTRPPDPAFMGRHARSPSGTPVSGCIGSARSIWRTARRGVSRVAKASRVALARAFATEPALLLDEPLSAPDAPSRATLLPSPRQ